MRRPSKIELPTSLTDPVHFASDVLGARMWRRQRDIMRAVATKRLVAVKACHASGKTFAAARFALWWLLRYPDGKVIITAPVWRQVKLMWEEIRLALQQSRIAFPQSKATELWITDRNYIRGISTNEAVKFQGIHGHHVLIIADEAPGIRADIWDAIEGVRAGGDVHLLILGNPVIPGGFFYDAFTRGRSIWETFTIGAFDTPNFVGLNLEKLLALTDDELARPPLPYLITPQWVKERALGWGEKHPMFQARVLGDFPTQSDYCVFSLDWIERARRDPMPEESERLKHWPIQVGIDVAAGGESETVLAARAGSVVLGIYAFSEADPRGRVVRVLGQLQKLGRPLRVVVDSVGVGHNFATHLLDQGFEVYRFNAGFSSRDPERFVNLKAETYWGLRDRMEQGQLCQLRDDETEAQLSTILYRATPSGKTEIESKDDARKRGQRSPDRAEALAMACCVVDRQSQVFYGTQRVEISPV